MSELMERYKKALEHIYDLEAFIDLANELDKLSKQGRLNDMRRVLVPFCVNREQEAERRGAGIAAAEINRELGLELTTDGSYYLSRHGKAGVLER